MELLSDLTKWDQELLAEGQEIIPFGPELRQWRTALANAASAPARIALFGDSITAGWSVAARQSRWVDILRRRLQKSYNPSSIPGGLGFLPTHRGAAYNSPGRNVPPWGEEWTWNVLPTWNNVYGIGVHSAVVASGNWMETTFYGDRVDVLYTQYSGGPTMKVEIDGAEQVAAHATTSTAVLSGRRWSSGALTRGTHTVRITSNNGNLYLDGIMAYNGDFAAGVQVWEMAHYGWGVVGEWGVPGQFWDSVFDWLQPDLVVLSSGIQDAWSAFNETDLRAALNAFIDEVIAGFRDTSGGFGSASKTPSILLDIEFENAPIGGSEAYENHRRVYNEIAAERGAAVFSWYDLIGKAESGSDPYVITSDGLHPNEKGMLLIAEAMAAFLQAPVRDHVVTTFTGKGVVNHGTNAGLERPTGFTSVEWIGSVAPTNAIDGDTWIDTT